MERRRYARVAAVMRVRVRREAEVQTSTMVEIFESSEGTETIDCSMGGVCLRLPQPLEVGSTVVLELNHPTESIVVPAEVRWTGSNGTHGVEFIIDDEIVRQRIWDALNEMAHDNAGQSHEWSSNIEVR